MSRPAFIKGQTVDLVPLGKGDAEACWAWFNDMDILRTYGPEPLPVGLEKQEEYLAGLYARKDQMILGIQLKGDDSVIGIAGLSQIEWANQRAELTVCIGQKERWGKGIGTEVTRLVLDHAFRKLNLHSVILRVIAYNEAGVRCYGTCGFKLIGRRREAKLIDNQYHDVLYMDILAREYLNR